MMRMTPERTSAALAQWRSSWVTFWSIRSGKYQYGLLVAHMGLMATTGAITLEDDMWPANQVIAITMLLIPNMAAAEPRAPQIEKTVSMKVALAIIEGTIERCTNDGHKVSVVVVDKIRQHCCLPPGRWHQTTHDGICPSQSLYGCYQSARHDVARVQKAGRGALAPKTNPGIVLVGGGVPIKAGNEIIGAVGVSGAPGEELDEACAYAGIAKEASSSNRQ